MEGQEEVVVLPVHTMWREAQQKRDEGRTNNTTWAQHVVVSLQDIVVQILFLAFLYVTIEFIHDIQILLL